MSLNNNDFSLKLGSILTKGTNIGLILNPRNNEIEASLRSDLASKLRPGFPVKILNEGKTFDGSIRGYSRRKYNEKFIGFNGGDAVGLFYYQFLQILVFQPKTRES